MPYPERRQCIPGKKLYSNNLSIIETGFPNAKIAKATMATSINTIINMTKTIASTTKAIESNTILRISQILKSIWIGPIFKRLKGLQFLIILEIFCIKFTTVIINLGKNNTVSGEKM